MYKNSVTTIMILLILSLIFISCDMSKEMMTAMNNTSDPEPTEEQVTEPETVTPKTFTGEVERIGTAIDFGGIEREPSAMAWSEVDQRMYMVGQNAGKLMILDTDTGIATFVDETVHRFGDFESWPSAMTIHPVTNECYVAGIQKNRLIKVNLSTGVGERVSPDGFGANIGGPSGLEFVGDTLYMTSRSTHKLLTIDLETGTASPVNDDADMFGIDLTECDDITNINGELYVISEYSKNLFKVDAQTGIASVVLEVTKMPNRPTALEWDGESLWVASRTTDGLYRLIHE